MYLVALVSLHLASPLRFPFQVCGVICLKMSALARSLNPLLRTTRLAVKHQNGVNPVQRVFGRDRHGVRGLATVFERTKPHVNIGSYCSIVVYGVSADPSRYHWARRSWKGRSVAAIP